MPRALADVQIGSAFAMPAELVVTVPVPQVTLKVIVPVELPPFVTQPAPAREVTPVLVKVTVPVLFETLMPVPEAAAVTPVLLRTFPVSARPVEIEVVPTEPDAFRNASVFVANEKMVELLNVAVEFTVRPPVKVCNVVHVTLDAAVTKPGFVKV